MNRIVIIGAGAVIALVFGLLLAWPQYQNLQALNSNIENKKGELSSQETYFSQVKEISAQLQDYSEAFSKIATALPQDPSLASLVNFLQTNAAQTGLILKKIVLGGTTTPSENKKSLSETQLIVQVSGSYEAFKDFLLLIENSARLIEVQNLSVDTPAKELKETKESPTFTLDLKTASY